MNKLNIYSQNMDPETGGIQNTAYYFVEEFSKKFQVKAYTTCLPTKYKNRIIEETDKITRWKAFCWLFRNSDKDTINMVLTCWEGIPAYFVNLIKKTPYIVLAHGEDVYNVSSNCRGIKLCVLNFLNKKILKKAEMVCCNSRYTYNLLNWINDKKKIIIHPPCKLEDDNKEIRVDFDCNIIFSVGRLVERKGFQFVIEAIAMIKKQYPQIKYYIAGDGPYKNKLKELITKFQLEKNVFLLGRVSDEEKNDYMKKCGVLIMPSYDVKEERTVEGFGIVFIEANQYGKYVIGNKSGGIEDAIIDGVTGVLIDCLDVKNVSDVIVNVLNDFQNIYVNDLIIERKKWAEKHSVKNIVAQYENVIRNIN